MPFDIIIVGAGGFGREVMQWARSTFDRNQFRLKGFLDDDSECINNTHCGLPWLGSIAEGKDRYAIQENDRFLYAIGNIENKRSIIQGLKKRGAQFINLIHPTAIVSDSAKLGEGVVVCPFALVSDQATLDDFTMVNFYASCAHDVTIGKYSILSPYATVNGFSQLEEEVFLGTHATVTAYLSVGTKSKISANSVAMKDVPPNSIVYGVPGKSMRIFAE